MPLKGLVLVPDRPCQNGCTCGTSQVPALEHVANRPIAHHVLDALVAAGVEQIIVAGTSDVLIDVRACLNRYQPKPPRLEFAVCPPEVDMTSALRVAAPLVGAAPCIVHVGDGLLDEPVTPYVEALQDNSLDLLLLCQGPSFSEPSARSGGNRSMVPNTIPGLLGDAGIGVFGPGAFRTACEVEPTRQPSSLDLLAQHLSENGRHVQVRLADGWRRYRGNPKDLLEVNRLALDLLAPRLRATADGQNRIEGRVQIDRTASVTTSVIVGPVVVGEGAEVTNAYIGPYTSIGAGARIEGVEIERSIISPGASVMHVGARIDSSLVGRGAHVFRDFSLPRAMRLLVGQGDEVALC